MILDLISTTKLKYIDSAVNSDADNDNDNDNEPQSKWPGFLSIQTVKSIEKLTKSRVLISYDESHNIVLTLVK